MTFNKCIGKLEIQETNRNAWQAFKNTQRSCFFFPQKRWGN